MQETLLPGYMFWILITWISLHFRSQLVMVIQTMINLKYLITSWFWRLIQPLPIKHNTQFVFVLLTLLVRSMRRMLSLLCRTLFLAQQLDSMSRQRLDLQLRSFPLLA